MTEGGHGGEPLTPEEEAAVASMLAQAGGPVRTPDDVVSRLDEVLAGLEAERSTAAGADLVELRARRRWPRLLVAAAAVVVGGYTVATVATQGTLGGSDEGMGGATSDAAADAGADTEALEDSRALDEPGATSPEEGFGGDTPLGSSKGPAESAPRSESGKSSDVMLRAVRLRSDRLDAGVRRALGVLDGSVTRSQLTKERDLTCPAPDLGQGQRSLDVRYDGEAAVLVAGPERRGIVEVTVWSCAGDELASTLVRRP